MSGRVPKKARVGLSLWYLAFSPLLASQNTVFVKERIVSIIILNLTYSFCVFLVYLPLKHSQTKWGRNAFLCSSRD